MPSLDCTLTNSVCVPMVPVDPNSQFEVHWPATLIPYKAPVSLSLYTGTWTDFNTGHIPCRLPPAADFLQSLSMTSPVAVDALGYVSKSTVMISLNQKIQQLMSSHESFFIHLTAANVCFDGYIDFKELNVTNPTVIPNTNNNNNVGNNTSNSSTTDRISTITFISIGIISIILILMLLIYFIRTYFTKTDNLKRRENQYLDHQTHLNNFDGKLSNHLLITPHPRNSTSTIHKASKEYSIHSDRDDYLNDSSGDCLLGDTLEEEDIREAQFQSFKYFQSDLNTNTITLLKPLDTQSFLIANERVLDHLQSPTGSNSDAPTSATCKLIGNDIGLISVHSNSTINVVDGVEHKQISNSKIQNDIITNNSLSPLLFNEADDGFSDFVADLQQEYKLLKDTAPDGVYLFPDLNDDVLKWTGIIFVQCGPFQGGIYRFNIQLQHDYPKQPPLLCLTTPITHPFFQPHSGKLFLIPNMIKSNRIISILIYLKSIMELQSDIQTVIQQNINNPTFQSYLNRDVLDWFLFHPSRFMTEAKINATNSQSRIYMTEDGEVTFPEWNSHLHAGLISKVLGYSEH